MAKSTTLINEYAEGGAADGETNLIAALEVAANTELKITDMEVNGDSAAWFWISTDVAGVVAGHIFKVYLAAAGAIPFALETPVYIDGGDSGVNVYVHYDTGNLGTLFTAGYQAELLS